MMRFFKAIKRGVEVDSLFRKVIELSKNEKTREQALEICKNLANECPRDVQIRRQLLLLQKDLGLKVDLPKLSAKSI